MIDQCETEKNAPHDITQHASISRRTETGWGVGWGVG